jgi:hypothetical protein
MRAKRNPFKRSNYEWKEPITMKRFFFILFTVSFLQLTSIYAQPNKAEIAKRFDKTNSLIKPIEAYVKKVENFVKGEGNPHVIIADSSDYNGNNKPIWKKHLSEESFKTARNKKEFYTIVYIWKRNRKVVQTSFTYFSPSGDWVQYVYYIFNEDGSLAKVDRELRTFMNDIIVNRIHFYDKKGKLLKTIKNFRDLSTRKLIKAPKSFEDIDV